MDTLTLASMMKKLITKAFPLTFMATMKVVVFVRTVNITQKVSIVTNVRTHSIDPMERSGTTSTFADHVIATDQISPETVKKNLAAVSVAKNSNLQIATPVHMDITDTPTAVNVIAILMVLMATTVKL